jgi:hypothetical protein
MKQLSPCPFCSHEIFETHSDQCENKDGTYEYWFVQCQKCLTEGPLCKTEEDAKLAWNTRT